MTTKPQSTTEPTRVKERLNLFYHGLKEREKPIMFQEVREWLREMDDAETESLHSIIYGLVHRHCKDVQLPSGTNGLENDLIEALNPRLSPASAAPVVDRNNAARSCEYYAEMIELQNDLSGQTENWQDFHRGQHYAVKQLADLFRLAAATAAPAEQSDDTSAERDFLEASIAVWREIDRLSVLPDGYHGLKQSTDLRKRELAAWEAYRAVLDSTTPVAAPQEEVPIGGEVRSSRHPHFTHADHERMKETLDSLSDYPTEEEAEAVLQACGTSGKEVVNEFIERLLKENLELKTKLESVTAPLSTLARKAAEELNKRGFLDHELFATVSDERMKQIAAIIERCLFRWW